MYKIKVISVLAVLLVMFSGFWDGKSKSEVSQDNSSAKQERVNESQKTLRLLYKYAPDAKDIIGHAYGYATFSNLGASFFISVEGGKGLAHNNETSHNTYMNMGSVGGGISFGVKDFRAVFLFENKKAFRHFINNGWQADAQADAAAKSGKNGDAYNGAVSVAPGIRLYKLTQNGLVVGATIQGTKYWKDGDLN